MASWRKPWHGSPHLQGEKSRGGFLDRRRAFSSGGGTVGFDPPMTETLDLRGVRCPLSWARAKVRLESLQRRDELTLLLDDPRGVRDIPRAAEASGYAVSEPVRQGEIWVLTITV